MKNVTRAQAIENIRNVILSLVDEDHSVCETAKKLGVFCHGFGQFSDEDLAERFQWIVKRKSPKTREELEELADRWQLARQFVQNKELACDVQVGDQDTCRGWNTFTDEKLTEFHRKLCGEDIAIVKD